jgi:hypothetical protein
MKVGYSLLSIPCRPSRVPFVRPRQSPDSNYFFSVTRYPPPPGPTVSVVLLQMFSYRKSFPTASVVLPQVFSYCKCYTTVSVVLLQVLHCPTAGQSVYGCWTSVIE